MHGNMDVKFVKLCQIKFGNEAKSLKYSEKNVFRTNLEQMFKLTATDSDTQPTKTQQTMT
jgi:hypothetical protein